MRLLSNYIVILIFNRPKKYLFIKLRNNWFFINKLLKSKIKRSIVIIIKMNCYS